MDDGAVTFSLTMLSIRRILASFVLLLALAGLTVSGDEAVTKIPDQQAASMAEDGMLANGMLANGLLATGMLDRDGCGDSPGSLAACAMHCGLCCAGDLDQIPGSRTNKLVAVGAVSARGFVLPPGVALSQDPPRPKSRSL